VLGIQGIIQDFEARLEVWSKEDRFMRTKVFFLVALLVISLAVTGGASKDAFSADFFKGKTIKFIVGASPGGGYDTYTRLVARYIGKYVPGNPATLVSNMPGGGMLIAANYINKRAKADGLTIGLFNNALIVQKGLGDPKIKIDFRKMGWVGAPSVGMPVCMIMAFTGLKSLEDILKYEKRLIAGATRAGSTGHDLPMILNKTLGTNIEVVTGYGGTATTRIALQSRELNIFCSQWESMRVTARAMLDAPGDDKLVPFITHSKFPDPELKGLPLFRDVIKGKKNLAIYNAWVSQMEFQRPYSLPPGTPKDRIGMLRKALKAALQDPKLLKEAKKSKLIITHVTGEKVVKYIDEILTLPQHVIDNLDFLVRKKKKRS
jgi:tripartite-type tricarboxylate transporter receptor subunit TctC